MRRQRASTKWAVLVLAALGPPVAGCRRSPAGVALPPAELEVTAPAGEVGFGAEVQLRARVRPPGSGNWRLSWRQVWGPPPVELHPHGDGLRLRTPWPPSAEQARPHRDRPLPLSAEAAGRMAFRVCAEREEDGVRLERTVEVIPAFPSPGWPRLALGTDLYICVDPASRSAWGVQQGGVQLLPGPAPHLLRARGLSADWYRLRAPGGELWLRGGAWLGDGSCGRYDCHPRERAGWQRTAHASVLTRALSGTLSSRAGPYQDHCLPCHTVGHQPGSAAVNDGFDDRARLLGWRVPARLSPRVARELPTVLRERANVQCEACHGPGWFYVGYGEAVCGQCHDLPPRYLVVAQSRRNRMRVAERAVGNQPPGTVCRDCHQADEVLRSLRGHRSTSRPGLELDQTVHGVTCAVCHDPHQRDCRRQLRFCGDVEIPGGTVQAGQGALCVSCHTGEANVRRGPLLRPFLPGRSRRAAGGGHGREGDAADAPREPEAAPHAPQFQVLSGRGGKFLRLPDRAPSVPPVYPHLQVPDTCVGCHYLEEARRDPRRGHTFKLLDEPDAAPAARTFCAVSLDLTPLRRSRVTGSCRPCHGQLPGLDAPARGDYDGNGRVEGLVTEVEQLLLRLRRELEQQIRARRVRDAAGRLASSFAISDERVVLTDAACQPLRGAGGSAVPRTLLGEGPLLHKAAFNFLLVLRDGSGGLHNPQYTVTLLQSTLEELELARGAARRRAWKRP